MVFDDRGRWRGADWQHKRDANRNRSSDHSKYAAILATMGLGYVGTKGYKHVKNAHHTVTRFHNKPSKRTTRGRVRGYRADSYNRYGSQRQTTNVQNKRKGPIKISTKSVNPKNMPFGYTRYRRKRDDFKTGFYADQKYWDEYGTKYTHKRKRKGDHDGAVGDTPPSKPKRQKRDDGYKYTSGALYYTGKHIRVRNKRKHRWNQRW